MSRNLHIIIVEPDTIIFEGLVAVFLKSGLKPNVSKADTFDEIQQLHLKRKSDIIIISPSLIQNNVKLFNALKSQFENVQWIGLVYAYYDQHLLSLFDAFITISDTPEIIAATINKLFKTITPKKPGKLQDVISDREIDVLKLLASGLANKEIADKLNISINTVITHRKNISKKTGIKSVSGLTIYAVLRKLVTIEDFSE